MIKNWICQPTYRWIVDVDNIHDDANFKMKHLYTTKICGRTACRSQHILHRCLCSILRLCIIFDLATKTNWRNTGWTAPQMCPSSVLRRKRFPHNFVRRKTCYLCASHHVTITLWSTTSVAEFQSPTKPTIWCFVHVDNSVEVKAKTTTHNQNLPAKSKSVGGKIFLGVPPSTIVEIACNPRPDNKKKSATHHQQTTTDTSIVTLPIKKKNWTPHQSANKISPPTLHILITGTIHHVCSQRTPRGTRDTTTIPMTVTNFHLKHTITQTTDIIATKKNAAPQHCTTTTLREPFINCVHHQHSNAHDFNKSSAADQHVTSHIGNRKHEWRNTPRSDNTVIKKHVLEDYNDPPTQPTNFH